VPIVEIEATIVVERAGREATPVKAVRLIIVAVVVRVAGALEGRGIKPSLMVM
jgi:hypothetical protein